MRRAVLATLRLASDHPTFWHHTSSSMAIKALVLDFDSTISTPTFLERANQWAVADNVPLFASMSTEERVANFGGTARIEQLASCLGDLKVRSSRSDRSEWLQRTVSTHQSPRLRAALSTLRNTQPTSAHTDGLDPRPPFLNHSLPTRPHRSSSSSSHSMSKPSLVLGLRGAQPAASQAGGVLVRTETLVRGRRRLFLTLERRSSGPNEHPACRSAGSWLSGGVCQRQSPPQAAPSSGPPRPISRLGRAGPALSGSSPALGLHRLHGRIRTAHYRLLTTGCCTDYWLLTTYYRLLY